MPAFASTSTDCDGGGSAKHRRPYVYSACAAETGEHGFRLNWQNFDGEPASSHTGSAGRHTKPFARAKVAISAEPCQRGGFLGASAMAVQHGSLPAGKAARPPLMIEGMTVLQRPD